MKLRADIHNLPELISFIEDVDEARIVVDVTRRTVKIEGDEFGGWDFLYELKLEPPTCKTCGTVATLVNGRRKGTHYWHCWKCDTAIPGRTA